MRVMLPYPVSANKYWRKFGRNMVVSPQAIIYKAHAAMTFMFDEHGAKRNFKRIDDGGVFVRIILHPKLTVKGRASNRVLDLDNTIKVTLDALNKIAYWDDSQVRHIDARFGEPVVGGGLTVEVQEIANENL